MALSLNNFGKYNSTNGRSILGTMINQWPFTATGSQYCAFNIYLNTTAYSFANCDYSSSSGRAFNNTKTSGSWFTISGNNIIFTGGTLQLTPSQTGTIGWWALTGQYGTKVISDSITTLGGGGILQTSSLSVTSGTPVTFTFSMSIT